MVWLSVFIFCITIYHEDGRDVKSQFPARKCRTGVFQQKCVFLRKKACFAGALRPVSENMG
ncbi:MAG: hypothetical protein DRP66_08715 [Planctomycetota bacterium]|nr:MAG: hypothetical protein DRP66_08715 [Planctomycetota bacterium]